MTLSLKFSQQQLCDALMWWGQWYTVNLIISPWANYSFGVAVIVAFCRADESSVAAVAGVVPPGSCLRAQVWRELPPLNRLFFFTSSPSCESVLLSNEIFRCAVCWSMWPWPTVASSDVYLLHLRHFFVATYACEEMSPQLLCNALAASNRNSECLKCFCMIFYYSRWGKRVYISTLS